MKERLNEWMIENAGGQRKADGCYRSEEQEEVKSHQVAFSEAG
jgi:hypothetical protein